MHHLVPYNPSRHQTHHRLHASHPGWQWGQQQACESVTRFWAIARQTRQPRQSEVVLQCLTGSSKASGWIAFGAGPCSSPVARLPRFVRRSSAGCLGWCAGGIVVHTVGGMASLIGTYFIGPRAGRFGIDGQINKDFRENNGNLVVLGTFLLWFGW